MKLLITLIFIISLFSQEKKSYETISVQLGFHTPSFNTELNDFYTSQKHFELIVLTPYHIGELYAGIKHFSFQKLINSTSDFSSNYIFLGWQLPLINSEKLTFNFGFQLGSFEMNFDEETKWFYKKESEFATSIQSNISYKFSQKINIHLRIENQQIFTYHRIYINTISAGTSYTFGTPQWLKHLLN